MLNCVVIEKIRIMVGIRYRDGVKYVSFMGVISLSYYKRKEYIN